MIGTAVNHRCKTASQLSPSRIRHKSVDFECKSKVWTMKSIHTGVFYFPVRVSTTHLIIISCIIIFYDRINYPFIRIPALFISIYIHIYEFIERVISVFSFFFLLFALFTSMAIIHVLFIFIYYIYVYVCVSFPSLISFFWTAIKTCQRAIVSDEFWRFLNNRLEGRKFWTDFFLHVRLIGWCYQLLIYIYFQKIIYYYYVEFHPTCYVTRIYVIYLSYHKNGDTQKCYFRYYNLFYIFYFRYIQIKPSIIDNKHG